MKIDSKFLRGEPLERWVKYMDDFELRLTYPEPAEWDAAVRGKNRTDGESDAAVKALAARHVADWRNLEDENGPVPCTPANVAKFVERDKVFGLWLTATLANCASFRNPAGDGAAGQVRTTDAPAAA